MTGGTEQLVKALKDSVYNTITGRTVAIAFSGGLDSGIIAALAKECGSGNTLYTVGSENSHDILGAGAAAADLGMRWVSLLITENDVLECLKEMISVTGTTDPVTLSFEIPLFFVCKNCEEKDIITGQGADELFAGYSKYVGLDANALEIMIADDMKKLSGETLPHEKMVAEHFGKRIHYPYLDNEVIKAAGSLASGTIAPDSDPLSRKKALRTVSDLIGYPNISKKEKKAAQYSSGAMVLIKKICKEKGVTYRELIETLSGEVT